MSAPETINVTLKVWRQNGPEVGGRFETIAVNDVETHSSFLEMLDFLNEKLILEDKEPIEFDNDCREGICGTCGAVVNGIPHGHRKGETLCQIHMREFNDGDTIVVEPFRSRAFKVVKDLMVDRSALDKIIQAGGYISVDTGGAPDANALPIAQEKAEEAMDAAACVGCGACVASCPNASAMLFVSAKVSQLALLPQGRPEATRRVLAMLKEMDSGGFGNCTNHRVCENACPKEVSITHIARFNREFLKAALFAKTAK
ncbi:MAG: succinate dehydrogenase/fumarate reductase iron-sulfur subunit [Deltaproteobacteria bacterium]|jgi:succinate dehydrogenase / fumarate reductase iron-sulfur subunit|nr:succinate dehydrogenase/fumarate reductase iron-sulfur subunit [Deltaproteobacteria bacterium]